MIVEKDFPNGNEDKISTKIKRRFYICLLFDAAVSAQLILIYVIGPCLDCFLTLDVMIPNRQGIGKGEGGGTGACWYKWGLQFGKPLTPSRDRVDVTG